MEKIFLQGWYYSVANKRVSDARGILFGEIICLS